MNKYALNEMMPGHRRVTIEGYTAEELLELPEEQVDAFASCNAPVAFRIGSAEIPGQFKINEASLTVEPAHIDGGEGVLSTTWSLAERYAAKKGLNTVGRVVHAAHCANPNLKLRRLLELRGFAIKRMAGAGEVYHCVHAVAPTAG